jgi:hypothetical protein
MQHNNHIRIAKHFASPYGMAAISSVVFLISCAFPPNAYLYFMNEPELIFLDVRSIAFYALCVGAFLLGVALVDRLSPSKSFNENRIKTSIPPAIFILMPLLLALGLNIRSIISVIRDGELVSLLLDGKGGEVKEALSAQGSLVLSGTSLMGVLWWATWRYQQLKLKGMSRWLTRVVLYVATCSTVFSAYLKLGRCEMMPVIAGLAVILFLRKLVANEVTRGFMLKFSGVLALSTLVLFIVFIVPRGADNADKIGAEVVACTVASYNRLSAVLAGNLRYPYGGTGVYLSGFLPFNNLFNSIVPLREIFNWPTFYDVWMSEFQAVGTAGLNRDSIWSGTFGYIFSDLGWLSPMFVFTYGVLTGWAWRSIRRGQTMGIVLYPWCAFCVLFWSGINLLLSTNFVMLVIVATFLLSYEFLLLRRRTLYHQCRAI